MLQFLRLTTAPGPMWLCEDMRWRIHGETKRRACRGCGAALALDGRVAVCFVRDGCLCFQCWHRTRCPRAA